MKRYLISLLNLILFIILVIASFQCHKTNDTVTSYRLTVDKIFPNIGEAGTLVTISGKGYSLILTEDTVWFNGKPAQIKLVTDSTVEVFAPANNSTGIIRVSVRGKNVDGPTFTYVQKDEPAITAINPEVGWDYTMNSVTIKGIHFGTDRTKVSVLFDNMAASLQSFSDTSLIVAPPQHAAGRVPVVVVVNGKTSNTVYYTYQQKPIIAQVYRDRKANSTHPPYMLAVQNLSSDNSLISVTANGVLVPLAGVYRQGSAAYNDTPVGDKIMLREDSVDKNLTSNAVDFVVTSSGLQSDVYHFVNDPVITNITTSHTRPYSFGGGDTVLISGKYFGTKTQTSVVELWDSVPPTNSPIHFVPDPTIVSWANAGITMIVPSYSIITVDSLKMQVRIKENGKEADAYAVFYKQQQPPAQTGTVTLVTNRFAFKGMAVDSHGNIFGSSDYVIKKIATDGTITTFAGSGSSGNQDGNGTQAQFGLAYSLAIDAQDNLYVTDILYGSIRKITPSANVSTFFRQTGHHDLDYSGMTGITADAQGNLFLTARTTAGSAGSTYPGDIVFEVTQAGSEQLIAGSDSGYVNGPAANSKFNYPVGITLDESGNLYVAENNNNRVRKIASGIVSTVAGSGATSASQVQGTTFAANQVSFYAVGSVVSDKHGNIYIADQYWIFKLNVANQTVTVFAGQSVPNSNGRFYLISALAIDTQRNILYVSDQYGVYKIAL